MTTPHRYRVLAYLFVLILVMYLDRLAIAVAGPRIQADLHLTPVQWGWVIGAFTIAYAAFEIPSGALGDRIGSRAVLTRIVLWWSAFTAATGMVSSYGPLLAVRFLFGAGEAGAFPNCASTVARWTPQPERARSLSVLWIATGIGGMLTPLLVVTIQKQYGWRLSFYLFAVLGVVWSAAWYTWFRNTPREMPGVTDEERALIGAGSAPSRHAVMPWGLLVRNRNFLLLLLMYHFYCWGAYFYLSWLHTYLQIGRKLTEDQMKIASTLPSAVGLIGVVAGGWLSDRLARRHTLRFARCSIGAVSLAGSGVLLLAASLTPDPWAAVALLSLGLGVMNGMLPVSWALCVDLGGEHSGALSGAMNTAGQLGSFLSSVCFGYMVQGFGSYDRALMPLAAMLIAGGVTFALIDPAGTPFRSTIE
jgi:MFS transporter, ACS family, glucarate transporter